MSKQNHHLPDGMDWVIPYLLYRDAAYAINWLVNTFGITERVKARKTDQNGKVMHAELEHNGDLIMLGGAGPNFKPQEEKNILLYLYVDDVEAHFQHSKEAGANITIEPEGTDYGDQRYWVEDPGGHTWIFAQRVFESEE